MRKQSRLFHEECVRNATNDRNMKKVGPDMDINCIMLGCFIGHATKAAANPCVHTMTAAVTDDDNAY
jgi:hypothetical protein